MPGPASTDGYSESAPALIDRYESVTFEQLHQPVLNLFPSAPSRVLDIGAGTGRDAAALALCGHRVTAVEPTAPLRAFGQSRHPISIRWIDDMLPRLPAVRALGELFDLVLLTAVWMHLDAEEQAEAMCTVASLLAPGGRLSMSLRHGPVPEGRRMFDVDAAQVTALASGFGLEKLHEAQAGDMLGRADVRWTFLVLQRPGP